MHKQRSWEKDCKVLEKEGVAKLKVKNAARWYRCSLVRTGECHPGSQQRQPQAADMTAFHRTACTASASTSFAPYVPVCTHEVRCGAEYSARNIKELRTICGSCVISAAAEFSISLQ